VRQQQVASNRHREHAERPRVVPAADEQGQGKNDQGAERNVQARIEQRDQEKPAGHEQKQPLGPLPYRLVAELCLDQPKYGCERKQIEENHLDAEEAPIFRQRRSRAVRFHGGLADPVLREGDRHQRQMGVFRFAEVVNRAAAR
jgi:hypothetical protein